MPQAQSQRPEQGTTKAAQEWDSCMKLCVGEGGETDPSACTAFMWLSSTFLCSPNMERHTLEKQSAVHRIAY